MTVLSTNSYLMGPKKPMAKLSDGDKRKYELWERKILGYLRLKPLNENVLNQPGPDDTRKR